MRTDKYAILFFLLYRTVDSRPSECNLVECPSPPHCCKSGEYTSDNRLCCMTCARQEQEPCGGAEGAKCARGLQCLKTCEGCKTIGTNSRPCIFPFKYSGATYNKCTARDSDAGHPWCATQVDEDDNHVIDNEWGDCAEGCPGLGIPCNEEYFKSKEGICVNLRTPGSVPNGGVGPEDHLMQPTADLFPAPLCNGKEDDKGQSEITCNCDRSSTAVEIDNKGRKRGNCTGIAFQASKRKKEFWCFLENVDDPLNPQSRCYEDTKWSYNDGRFWSSKACPEPVPDVQKIAKRLKNEEKRKSDERARFESLQALIFDSKKRSNRRPKKDKRKETVKKESDQKENILQISSNGKQCIFPFIYDGKLYTGCTAVDSDTGIPWCATGIDNDGIVIDNDWGDCIDNGKDLQMDSETSIIAEELSEELNAEKDMPITEVKKDLREQESQEQKISSNGKSCIFPFIYDGTSYAGCTIKDSDNGTPWCATGIDLDGIVIDNDWGDCLEQSGEDESESEALSNYDIYDTVFEELTTQETDINRVSELGSESQPNNEGEELNNAGIQSKEGMKSESRSTNTVNVMNHKTSKTIISSNDKPCIFPFKYEEVSYTSCTDKDSETGALWCATGVDTDGHVVADDWGECVDTSQAEKEQTTQSSSWFAWLG